MGPDMERARARVVAEVLAESPRPPTMVAARLLADVLRDLPEDVSVEETRLRTRMAKGVAQAELREFVAAGMSFTGDMEFARTLLTAYPPAALEAVAPLLEALGTKLHAQHMLVLTQALEKALARRPADDWVVPYATALLSLIQAFLNAPLPTPPTSVTERPA